MVQLLQSGASDGDIRKRLQEGRVLDSEADQLVVPLVEQWKKVSEKTAQRKIRTGVLWAAGGLVVTLWSYAAVAQSGGTYVIAWGAVVFGILRVVDGLSLSAKARRR